ncbi:MAG: hypothetical protein PVI86_06720 [Phycisphaerae bacterium]|jgi:hypothetical protein
MTAIGTREKATMNINERWYELEPDGWPVPRVRAYQGAWATYVRVEASMGSGTGVVLSGEACQKLWGFFEAYRTANGLGTDGLVGIGREGADIDVLPEHAAEMEARLRVFITDPANHEQVPDFRGANVLVVPDDDLASAYLVRGAPEDARDALLQVRQVIEAAYPDLWDDPLGRVPGVDRPPCTADSPAA